MRSRLNPCLEMMVVSTDKDWCRRLSIAVKVEQDVKIIGFCSNLMEAFTQAEEFVPDIVLVSRDFTRLPEFEMVLALFAALNIRWLSISSLSDAGLIGRDQLIERCAGVFMIDRRDRMDRTLILVRSLCFGKNLNIRAPERSATDASVEMSKSLVVLGSSTGGVDALTTMLRGYSEKCPPTVILQHTGAGYGGNLVRLFSAVSAAKILQAKDGAVLNSGCVYLAAGMTSHVEITNDGKYQISHRPGPPHSGHCPSVDVLFKSVLPIAERVVGGVLTGMGRDGAEGLLALRQAGARTFAQDERSSTVYGMPRVAWENGGAEEQVPLASIADHIMSLSRKVRKRVHA